jgi:perosamine synthetase
MSNRFYPVSQPSIGKREEECVVDAIRSGWVSSLGAYIEKFEEQFAAFCGTRHAITVSNGTTALHLALLAAGVKPGDEVIIPDLTFIATANVVVHAGAVPIFVDIDPQTLCLSPDAIASAVTSRTRAIMPVHLYGHPADMDRINEIAERRGLVVIEDAAEAHGAECRNRRVGSLGRCGVFSFYGNKVITTGEGGVITSDDDKLIIRARRLRDHAMSATRRYWHDEVGFNYRMTNLQAALGVAQLERIDEFIAKRRKILDWYRAGLADCAGIKLNRQADWAKPVCWMVCMEIEDLDEAARDQLMSRLKALGVDCRPYFYPVSDMPMYSPASTPVAHRISPTGINLPSYVDLSADDVAHICGIVRQVLAQRPLAV